MNRKIVELLIGIVVTSIGSVLMIVCFFIGKSFLLVNVSFAEKLDQMVVRFLFYIVMLIIGIIFLFKGIKVVRGNEDKQS